MELLILLPLLLLGGLISGGDDSDGADTPPEPEAPSDEVQTGTSADEELAGTERADLILGGRGGDLLEGLSGDDVLNGEFGNDTISGDAGRDIVLGAEGGDLLDGSDGDDLVIGGVGNDEVIGGGDDDALFGSSGRDSLFGGEGDDALVGVEFADVQGGLTASLDEIDRQIAGRFGSAATDRLVDRVHSGVLSGDTANTEPDVLDGGNGSDLLMGDKGDSMTGGAGIDSFLVNYRAGDASTLITDFNPANEDLLLLVTNPETAVVSFIADGAGGTILTVDGQPSVAFAGQTVASLTAGGLGWLMLEQI